MEWWGHSGMFGGQTLWTPAQITTALWLDAADAATITTVSGAVSQWDDKSGNNRNATQSTSANRPDYTANSINGLATLTFASTAKSMVLPSGNYAADPKVFVVIKSTSSSATQIPLRLQGSINEFFLVFNATASNQFYFTQRGLEQRPATNNVTDTTIYFGDLYSTSIGDYYVNGALATKAASISTAGGTSNSNIIGVDAGDTLGFQGSFAEYIVLSSIDTTTRQRIEGYLAHKWGLTGSLPAGHPYKTSPPYV